VWDRVEHVVAGPKIDGAIVAVANLQGYAAVLHFRGDAARSLLDQLAAAIEMEPVRVETE
jgi:hypothetical protein